MNNKPKHQTQEQIAAALIADGWREYPDQFKTFARSFFRRYNTPTRCHHNDSRPGVQIQVSVSEFDGVGSCELELCAELSDGTWVKLQNYQIPNGVNRVIACVPRLLATWEAMNKGV
jgi:hypothetical protein